jgi:hypothetical protein
MPPQYSNTLVEGDTVATRTRQRNVLSKQRLKSLQQSQVSNLDNSDETLQNEQSDLRPQLQKEALLL